jgi:hypothetical protein
MKPRKVAKKLDSILMMHLKIDYNTLMKMLPDQESMDLNKLQSFLKLRKILKMPKSPYTLLNKE